MNDVYVVHFEFVPEAVAKVSCFVICGGVVLFIINGWITCVVDEVYCSRNNRCIAVDSIFWLLFFTWPLYLLLVLIKWLVGACAYVWRKV